jgi:hypothetical protein
MKKSHKRPSRSTPKPVTKPAMKVAPPKPAPSLVDVKILVGQMKGMLTWMSRERAELQNMMAQVQSVLAGLGSAGSAEETADTIPSCSAEMPAEIRPNCDEEAHEEHGDPVVSGAFGSESEE